MAARTSYVHGYTEREAQRLGDQARAVQALLHSGTRYPAGAVVLEAGCGVGSQTVALAGRNPGARFVCLDIDAGSLAQARGAAEAAGLDNVEFRQGDLMDPPFAPASFDHVFVCFVLEHLARPQAALRALAALLRPGGTLTAIEGDHGSCYWHPETPLARRAWQCLVEAQAALGGDSLIGRRLRPLLEGAGLTVTEAGPRMIYADQADPDLMHWFVGRTITPMVAGVRDQALAQGLMDEAAWDQGLAELGAVEHHPQGVFCYTFFKALGRRTARAGAGNTPPSATGRPPEAR